MNATPFSMLPPGHWLLLAFVTVAAIVDWRTSRLPNALTFSGLACALAASVLAQGIGLLDAVLGAASAFVLLFPLWMMRVTGAGDVKLLAMVGAFLGVPGVFFALFLTMFAGGVYALGLGLFAGKLQRIGANARDLLQHTALAALHRTPPHPGAIASVGKLPYGVCVFAGTASWLAWQALHR
jgi:prepilin peptidase CpaA